MRHIDSTTSLEEFAALVSGALEAAGVVAVLSGGAAVTLYADNEYLSADLDFVTSARIHLVYQALEPLGFVRRTGARHFEHPDSALFVEFPPGPLAFGETTVAESEAVLLETAHGPLRIVTPTQSVMDRLTAYVHWRDGQSYDQAVMVARHQVIDWDLLQAWAHREGIAVSLIDELRHTSGG